MIGKTWMGMLAAFLMGMTGCDFEELAGSAQYREEFHYNYRLKPGGRLTLENFNGSVEIYGGSEDAVQIDGSKYAATSELLKALKIDVVADPDSVRIRTLRPSEHRGNMGAKYVLRVPRKLELESITTSNGAVKVEDIQGAVRLSTSNGAIRLAKIHGNLEARTSNGGIEAHGVDGGAILQTSNGGVRADDVRGEFEATTSNGGIRAQLAGASPRRPVKVGTSNGSVELKMDTVDGNDIHASTSNGGITLRLPASLQARVKARTSNASITTDFDVHREGLNNKTHLEGLIGNGGPTLDLTTSNGSIRLQKL